MQIEDKKQLRKAFKQQRKDISSDLKLKLDKRIAYRFLESKLYKNCDELLIYVSFDIEVCTHKIIETALKEKKVYCPRCVPGTNIIEFFSIKSKNDLVSGSYGILEPKHDISPQNLFSDKSVCVVPGLSFDSRGYRLGFGKGYYDRFLSDFNGAKVGVCYESFLCEHLPSDDYDISVGYLITEKDVYDFGTRKEEIYG